MCLFFVLLRLVEYAIVLLAIVDPRDEDEVKDAQDRTNQGVYSSLEEEENKVPDVAFAYTSSHPRAVMIMNLYTNVTGSTVIRSWWAEDVARLAVG